MYTIQNEFLKVTVAAMGAELMSIVAADGTEYIWQGDPKYWADRSPNIFPSVGRLTGGKYQLDGNFYELGCHGFASKSKFDVIKHEPSYLELCLTNNDETMAVYPRKFAFTIVYSLDGDKLDGAKDPMAKRAELENELKAASAIASANAGLVDDVIEPAATRQMIAAALNMLDSKRELKPAKKQGNLPL